MGMYKLVGGTQEAAAHSAWVHREICRRKVIFELGCQGYVGIHQVHKGDREMRVERRDILRGGNGSTVHGVLSNCKYPLMWLQCKIELHTDQAIEILRGEPCWY